MTSKGLLQFLTCIQWIQTVLCVWPRLLANLGPEYTGNPPFKYIMKCSVIALLCALGDWYGLSQRADVEEMNTPLVSWTVVVILAAALCGAPVEFHRFSRTTWLYRAIFLIFGFSDKLWVIVYIYNRNSVDGYFDLHLFVVLPLIHATFCVTVNYGVAQILKQAVYIGCSVFILSLMGSSTSIIIYALCGLINFGLIILADILLDKLLPVMNVDIPTLNNSLPSLVYICIEGVYGYFIDY